MQETADAVVLLTGMPIAGGLMVHGAAAGRVGEVLAGLVVAAILGGPSLVIALTGRLHRTDRER